MQNLCYANIVLTYAKQLKMATADNMVLVTAIWQHIVCVSTMRTSERKRSACVDQDDTESETFSFDEMDGKDEEGKAGEEGKERRRKGGQEGKRQGWKEGRIGEEDRRWELKGGKGNGSINYKAIAEFGLCNRVRAR
jgi:hypothetical protein